MKAIVTKYLGPTDFKGARFRASTDGGSVIVPFSYELNAQDNHARAAQKLAQKMGWTGRMVTGALPKGGYCHVFTEKGWKI